MWCRLLTSKCSATLVALYCVQLDRMLQLFVHVDVQLKCDTFSRKMYSLSCFGSIDDDYFYLL